jgi:hypothetical protein
LQGNAWLLVPWICAGGALLLSDGTTLGDIAPAARCVTIAKKLWAGNGSNVAAAAAAGLSAAAATAAAAVLFAAGCCGAQLRHLWHCRHWLHMYVVHPLRHMSGAIAAALSGK